VKITKTEFDGLLVIEPSVFADDRGWFTESYNKKSLSAAGLEIDFVQDNHSFSQKNVVRGLHFQGPPHAQTKLVRVLYGGIRDVVVDLRRNERTFGKYFALDLSSKNKKQLLVPKGFAHGFIVISDNAEVLYKCDEYYHPESEWGIIYDDPSLSIDWGSQDVRLSAKDGALPRMDTAKLPINWHAQI
jgi:dTDP-4-dehydrorhamnose 3,5-epimerase